MFIRSRGLSTQLRQRQCGKSWGDQSVHPGCQTVRYRQTERKRLSPRLKRSDCSTLNLMDGSDDYFTLDQVRLRRRNNINAASPRGDPAWVMLRIRRKT